MRPAHKPLLLVALAILIGAIGRADEKTGSGKYCHRTEFGACRAVRGLYGIYVDNNGIVDLRSKALFSSAGDEELDRMIHAAGGEFDHEVLGVFIVCPTSPYQRPERTRAVQSVCIQSYKSVKVVKSKRK